jgi:hypothetical protein
MNSTDELLRQEEFEEYLRILWANNKSPFLRPCNEVDADRYYQDYDTEFAWIVWQACNAKRQEEMARLRDELKVLEDENVYLVKRLDGQEAPVMEVLKQEMARDKALLQECAEALGKCMNLRLHEEGEIGYKLRKAGYGNE